MKGIDLFDNLADLVKQVDSFDGEWLGPDKKVDNADGTVSFVRNDAKLGWDVGRYLWEYSGQAETIESGKGYISMKNDPKHPTNSDWSDKLQKTVDENTFANLSKDEVYDFIFGLYIQNRVNEGLWFYMFEQGVTQKLLHRLLELEGAKL